MPMKKDQKEISQEQEALELSKKMLIGMKKEKEKVLRAIRKKKMELQIIKGGIKNIQEIIKTQENNLKN